jgi:hypothetical protein
LPLNAGMQMNHHDSYGILFFFFAIGSADDTAGA